MSTEREYPLAPIVGVGGIIISGERVLLIRRGTDPGKGSWSIPGGKLELGETLLDGVQRELLEETALQVRVVGLVEVFERISMDAESRVQHHYVIVDYLCEADSGEARAASDVADVAWVTESQLAEYSLTAAALQAIRKAFQMARGAGK